MKYVIGDIHGEISKLKSLISIICNSDKNPTFIFLGDYVDKGENSFQTLEFLSTLKKQFTCHFLLGNHEYYWKNFSSNPEEFSTYLKKYGGESTTKDFSTNSFGETAKKMNDLFSDFFNDLKLFWEDDKYLVTHSGLTENAYQVRDAQQFLSSDVLFNRYQFIGNQKFFNHKKIIFGHTGFYDVFYDQFKIGIDTSACYLETQPLTALCLDNELIIQSNGLSRPLLDLNTNSCPNIPRIKPYRILENQ